MNIVEAEKFFKEYDGNSFYMYDQDLLKYNQYRSMKISLKNFSASTIFINFPHLTIYSRIAFHNSSSTWENV